MKTNSGFKGEVLSCLDEAGMTSSAVADILKSRHPELPKTWVTSNTVMRLCQLAREKRIAVFKKPGEKNLYAKLV